MPRTANMKPVPLCGDWLKSIKELQAKDKREILSDFGKDAPISSLRPLLYPLSDPYVQKIYASRWLKTMREYGRRGVTAYRISDYIDYHEYITGVSMESLTEAECERLTHLPPSPISDFELNSQLITPQIAEHLSTYLLSKESIQTFILSSLEREKDGVSNPDYNFQCFKKIIDGLMNIKHSTFQFNVDYFSDEGAKYLLDKMIESSNRWLVDLCTSIPLRPEQRVTVSFLEYALSRDKDVEKGKIKMCLVDYPHDAEMEKIREKLTNLDLRFIPFV